MTYIDYAALWASTAPLFALPAWAAHRLCWGQCWRLPVLYVFGLSWALLPFWLRLAAQ